MKAGCNLSGCPYNEGGRCSDNELYIDKETFEFSCRYDSDAIPLGDVEDVAQLKLW